MPLQIDAVNKLILVTSPTTEVDAQTLHDFVEDYMASPVGLTNDSGDTSFLGDILKPEGKIDNPASPGNFSLIILLLNSEWQIQFWQGSGYTRVFGGKIVGGVNDEPLKATGAAGDISVLESPIDGTYTVVASGSGLSSGQDTKLNETHAKLHGIEGVMDHDMMMRAIFSVLCGNAVDAETNNVKFMSADMGEVRVTYLTDEHGNRTGAMWNLAP